MHFLYPSFLWGLLSLAVPLAVHLFNFRRTKKVYFTNVEFLRTVKVSTNAFRRLRQWLVLVARLLFLAFLVLTFAQPFVSRNNPLPADGRGLHSLYLDNSLSMQNQLGNERYLDLAVDNINGLLTALPNAPAFQLLTNHFDSQEQYAVGADKVRERLTSVGFSPTYRPLASVYQRQRSLLQRQGSGAQHQLFWFSDFQKSTAGPLERLPLDSLTRLYLVPVRAQTYRNVYVDSVWLDTPFVRPMQNNELRVRLVNAGNQAVSNLPARLFLADAQVSTANANLPANGTATTSFNFTPREGGLQRGRVTFDDSPVSFDNDYFFVLNASPSVRVAHLRDAPGTPDYVASALGNEAAFGLTTFNARNADDEQLVRADLVILEGIMQLDATLRATLDRFVRNGGSLLVIPPARPEVAFYANWLGGLGVRGVTERGPTERGPTERGPAVRPTSVPAGANNSPAEANPAPFVTLDPPDKANPFFADIFESTTASAAVAMPVATPTLGWQASGTRLLSFKTGEPFLSVTRAQRGKVYVLAAPLAPAFGNFATHALFVPMLYKIAALSKQQEALAYSFQDRAIALDVPNAQPNQVYKLRRDKLELTPDQRVVNNQLILELPQGNQAGNQPLAAGYYALTREGQTERLLAFNYDKRESELAFYTTAELKRLFANRKNVQVFDNVAGGDFVRQFSEQNIGVNLWKYCLVAALFFLLVETALLRLMKG